MNDLMSRDPDQLLTAKELAPLLRVRVKRVYELNLPTVRLTPRSLRYRVRDIQQWLLQRTTEGERQVA